MESIEPDISLPGQLCINDIDSCLYRIGLQVSPIRPNTKRSFIYRPIVIATTISIILVQRVVCLLVTDQTILYLMGDIGAFFGIRIYINTLIGLCQLFILASQLVYFSNHKRGIEPTFLRLFQMMSGSVPPIELGLNDRKQIMTLVNRTRKLLILLEFNCRYVVTFICLGVVFLTYAVHTPLPTAIIYGGISSITYCYLGHTLWYILGYQYLYFYILCKYLNYKQHNLYLKLRTMKNKKHNPEQFNEVLKIMRHFNNVYREIDEYNTTYISKYLFNLWLLLSAAFVILSYVELFVSLLLPMKLALFYGLLFYNGIFIHTISTAASVNYHVKLTYLPVNSVYITLTNQRPVQFHQLRILIKVP